VGATAPSALVSRGDRRGAPALTQERFEQLGARAEALSRESESAAEVLRFAAGLYRQQAAAAARFGRAPLSGNFERDSGRIAECAIPMLGYIAGHAPGPIAAEALARAGQDPLAPLRAYWAGTAEDDYLARAILRPYAQALATAGARPDRAAAERMCPFCAGAPWIGSRRSASDADGAARHLHCALCGGSWQVMRIVCPVCGESDPPKLPSFQSENYPGVRIEACETCKGYVKTIDLTLDARRVPEVDELLSLGMDLWAGEQGFMRIEPGLAGV
jgi:formate dehydrogenase maturation protein FdhE